MQITSTTQSDKATPALNSAAEKPAVDFNRAMQRQLGQASATPKTVDPKAREAAQQLVSTTLLQPVFAAMREDPLRVEKFHGGPGERMFGSQLDTLLADRVASKTDMPLIESIAKQFTRNHATTAYAPTGPAMPVTLTTPSTL